MALDLNAIKLNRRFIFKTGDSVPGDFGKISYLTGENTASTFKNHNFTDIGFYKATSNKKTEFLGVALLNHTESFLDNSTVKSTTKPLETGYPISDILLILAIILVLTECVLYHRRKVG